MFDAWAGRESPARHGAAKGKVGVRCAISERQCPCTGKLTSLPSFISFLVFFTFSTSTLRHSSMSLSSSQGCIASCRRGMSHAAEKFPQEVH